MTHLHAAIVSYKRPKLTEHQRRFSTRPGIVYADDGDIAYHAESHGYRGLSFP